MTFSKIGVVICNAVYVGLLTLDYGLIQRISRGVKSPPLLLLVQLLSWLALVAWIPFYFFANFGFFQLAMQHLSSRSVGFKYHVFLRRLFFWTSMIASLFVHYSLQMRYYVCGVVALVPGSLHVR